MTGSVFPALSPVTDEIPGVCCLLEEMGFGTTIWALDITDLATVSGLFQWTMYKMEFVGKITYVMSLY